MSVLGLQAYDSPLTSSYTDDVDDGIVITPNSGEVSGEVELTPNSVEPTSSEVGTSSSSSPTHYATVDRCSICFKAWDQGNHLLSSLPCGHAFGFSCIEEWGKQNAAPKCPLCNRQFQLKDVLKLYLVRVCVADDILHQNMWSLEGRLSKVENIVPKRFSKLVTRVSKLENTARQTTYHMRVQADATQEINRNMIRGEHLADFTRTIFSCLDEREAAQNVAKAEREAFQHNGTQHESSKDKGVTIPSSQKPFKSNFNENDRLENQKLERSKEKQVSTVSSEEALFSNVHEVELVQAGPEPREVSSPQSGILCVQSYNVKNVNAPILEAILKKHGDIAGTCVFTDVSIRTSLLEGVCDIVRRIEKNDVTNIMSSIKEIESQLHVAEAAKINVSWLRVHLEAIRRSRHEAKKKATMLMELQTNTMLVERAAKTDLKERHAKLVAAQNEFTEAERCVEVLKLVKKKLNNDVLECYAEKDLWARKQVM